MYPRLVLNLQTYLLLSSLIKGVPQHAQSFKTCLLYLFVCVHVHARAHTTRGQRTTFRSRFFTSNMEVPALNSGPQA